MRSATLTLLAIPLAGWFALSTSLATESDAKAGSEATKTSAQSTKKKAKTATVKEERIPLCGAGSISVEPAPPGGGHWEKTQSGGKAICQQPAGAAANQTGSGPVNTLEDIYVASSVSDILAPPPPPAPPTPPDKPR